MVLLFYLHLFHPTAKILNLLLRHRSTTVAKFSNRSSSNVYYSCSLSKLRMISSGMTISTTRSLLRSSCAWWVSLIKVINLRGRSMKTRISAPGFGKLVRIIRPLILWKSDSWSLRAGFMKHLPNLLKQESSSAATLVHVLLRMYHDIRPEHQAARPQIAERLVPYVVPNFLIWTNFWRNQNTDLVLESFETLTSSKLIVKARISLLGHLLLLKFLKVFVDLTDKTWAPIWRVNKIATDTLHPSSHNTFL